MKETKFKNTEIGMIPEEWEVRTINSFCSVKTGPFGSMLHAEDYVAKGTPIVTTEHFKNGILPLVGKDIPQVGIDDLKRMSSYTLTKDDIVFSRVGSVDINALVTVRQKGWLFSGRVLRVRPFKQTDSLYLHYGLLKHSVRSDIVSRAVGLTMASINTKILGETELSLPPINEQHSIASALTSIDNLISSLGKLIEKKKNIKQGAMQQLLTGKTRLKGFDEPWVEKKLGEVCSVKRGVRVVKRNLTTDGLYPVYQNTNIPLGYSNQYNVEANTPFVIIGGSAGQVGICRERYWAADDCAFFSCHNIYKEYLYYVLLLNQSNILHNVRTGTIPRLDRTFLSDMLVYISSNIAEQQAIATILTKMDNEITALEAKKTKYEAIKQGMMQQLLTGKIRLIS